ncbi:MAG: pirin family protein [Planctomycetota bacterium]
MITIRHAEQRGTTNLGWLDSRHSFSFGRYHDPEHVGIGPLLVINDDRVAPGGGFPEHPHRDMEIISYVVDGALAHKDSAGNESVLRRGAVQRMTAGSGIRHSEYNGSSDEPVRFLQIWIAPEQSGLEPSYEDLEVSPHDTPNELREIASRSGNGARIAQDASIHASVLEAGRSLTVAIGEDRRAWVQVVTGDLLVGDSKLSEGDGALVESEPTLDLSTSEGAEFLVFDLPGS